METIPFVLWIFVLSGHIFWKGQTKDTASWKIVEGPHSLNKSVNSDATFSCVASNVDFVHWFLNGTFVDNIKNLKDTQTFSLVNETTRRYNITFQLHDENVDTLNNSLISCQGFYDNVDEQVFELTNVSSPATLLIQGLLNAPTILNVDITNGSLFLNWLPPFILKGVSINWYLLTVNTTTTLEGPTNLEEQYKAYTDYYKFFDLYNGSCSTYHICVQAKTDAGLGEASCINKSKIDVPRALSDQDVMVNVAFEEIDINVSYSFIQDDCLPQRAHTFNIDLSFPQRASFFENVSAQIRPDGLVTLDILILQSYQGQVANATIELINNVGSTKSDPIKTDLFCIQDVHVSDNGQFFCLFASGCASQKCKIAVICDPTSTSNDNSYVFYLVRQNNSLFSQTGLIDCNINSSCMAQSLLAYSVYNDSDAEVPEVSSNDITLCGFATSNKVDLAPSVTSRLQIFTPTAMPENTRKTIIISSSVSFIGIAIATVAIIVTIVVCRKIWKSRRARKVIFMNRLAAEIRYQKPAGDSGVVIITELN